VAAVYQHVNAAVGFAQEQLPRRGDAEAAVRIDAGHIARHVPIDTSIGRDLAGDKDQRWHLGWGNIRDAVDY
jgi:hypothetical protein